jgi:putative ABC transport system ATP-binding protein
MSTSESPAIAITNLTKAYPGPDGTPVPVLSLPQLRLDREASLAISGPSGSGKTTLFHIVAGLLPPSGGEVSVLGEPIGRLSEAARDRFRARNIGYIFQTSNLLPGFSALENVLLAMGFAGTLPLIHRRRRAAELLERVGLSERLHYRPGQLSSGQQQRVAIARAMVHRPRLLVCDEPTSALDHKTGHDVMELLRGLARDGGCTLLVVTHDHRIYGFADRIAEMDDGRIVEVRRAASCEA